MPGVVDATSCRLKLSVASELDQVPQLEAISQCLGTILGFLASLHRAASPYSWGNTPLPLVAETLAGHLVGPNGWQLQEADGVVSDPCPSLRAPGLEKRALQVLPLKPKPSLSEMRQAQG